MKAHLIGAAVLREARARDAGEEVCLLCGKTHPIQRGEIAGVPYATCPDAPDGGVVFVGRPHTRPHTL